MARHGENIYKRKDGRYEGRYVTGKKPNGKTHFGYVYGRQYAEVRRKLNLKKAEWFQKNRNSNQGGKRTVESYIPAWIEVEFTCRVKASSMQTYRNLLNHHILPSLGHYRLSEITPLIVHEWLETLKDSGLASGTIRSIYRLLSSAMRFAQDEGIILKNPCRRIHFQQDIRRHKPSDSRF